MPKAEFLLDTLETPIGRARLVCDGEGRLYRFGWFDEAGRWPDFPAGAPKASSDPFGLTSALAAYFKGDVHSIDRLPVAFGGTAFQNTVWTALRTIPAGSTRSYGALAKAIGAPKAVRAVGLANGANPVGVVVPCHRVIGADGSLIGYGGGLPRKKWLLAHEARYAGEGLFGRV